MGMRDEERPSRLKDTAEHRLPAHEKRHHERYALREMFRCFVGGRKVLSLALDQGGGGAFFTMSKLPFPGSVMVVEVEIDLQQRQVFLVAEVARRQLHPVKGIGVRWLRAVGLGSPESLLAFVAHHLRFPINALRNEVVGSLSSKQRPVIDFEAGVLRIMSRAAQEEELGELMRRSVRIPEMGTMPPPMPEDTVEEMSPEDATEITDEGGMKKVDTPVSYRFGGQSHRGILRFASSDEFVIDSASPLPGVNGRLYVEWSDQERDGVGEVVLRGEVEREAISPAGTWRIEARITALSEGGRPGLYKEFLLRYGD